MDRDSNIRARRRLLIPLDLLQEVKAAVHKVTSKRISLYVPDKSKPDGVKPVAVGHGSVKKYASQVVDPPVGGSYKPVGWIETDDYKGPSDVQPYAAKQPELKPVASGQPDPDKFVPVFNWDSKHVWVFVKKPGQAAPTGPVAIGHKQVKKYAGKLGWLTQKMKLVGKIDPSVYHGPSDIYPLDWQPADGPPPFVPTADHAMAMVFQPGGAKPLEVATVTVLKPKVPTLAAPAETMAPDPGEFAVTGSKDPNGYPWLKHKGSGVSYSLLPGGQLAQWSADEQVYYPVVKTSGGWDIDHDAALIHLADLKKKPLAVPDDFVLPAGHKVTHVAKSYVMATTPDGTSVKWIKLTDHWVYANNPSEEYTPPAQAGPPPSVAEIPPGAPTAPQGFEVSGAPNANGVWPLKTSIYTDEGNWGVLPTGKLVQYNAWSGAYSEWTYGKAGWEKSTGPEIPAAAVALLKYYPAGGPKIPAGYTFSGYDANGLPTATSAAGTTFTILPNGARAKWSDSTKKYKTATGSTLTLDQILAGDFGAAVVVKTEVAKTPEPPPVDIEYTGKVDANGYPLVDEIFNPEESDEDYTEKGLTLLPDDRVGRWSAVAQVYQVYGYDHIDGYTPSKTYETLDLVAMERLLHALHLVVQNGRYHKVTVTGGDEPHAPEGFKALTPDLPVEKGLVPVEHVASGKTYYMLPGDQYAGAQAGAGLHFDVFAMKGGALQPTALTGLSIVQVRLMTKGLDPNPADHSEFTGAVDVNGYPLVKTEAGDKLTLLPNGELANWEKAPQKYEVWEWDDFAEDYLPSHPTKYYSLKQLAKMKPKTLPGAPLPVSLPTATPAPEADAPVVVSQPLQTTPEPGELVPMGSKNQDGYEEYEYGPTKFLVKLPIGEVGKWASVFKAYRIYKYNPETNEYLKQGTTWWFKGEPEIYTGVVKPGGVKKVGEEPPKSLVQPTGETDPHGYPVVAQVSTGKTYTQLPDGRIAVWSQANGAYLLYDFDTLSNSYFNSGKTWQPPGFHQSQANHYLDDDHPLAGLQDAKGTAVVVMPGPQYFQPVGNEDYMAMELEADGTFKGTSTILTKHLLKKKLQKNSAADFAVLRPKGQVDDLGLPLYGPDPDYDDLMSPATAKAGLSLLPNGEFALRRVKPDQYAVYHLLADVTDKTKQVKDHGGLGELDHDTAGWAGAKIYYTLAEVHAMKKAPKEWAPAAVAAPVLPDDFPPEVEIDPKSWWAASTSTPTSGPGKAEGVWKGLKDAGIGFDHDKVQIRYTFFPAADAVWTVKGMMSGKKAVLWSAKSGYSENGLKAKVKAPALAPAAPAPTPAPFVSAPVVSQAEKDKDIKAAEKPSELPVWAGKLPDVKTLTHLGDGNALGLGGAGKKDVYQDPATGQKYIFKPSIPKSGSGVEAFRAHAQEAFAALAVKVRPGHIPVQTVKIKGKLGTLQPMIDLHPSETLRKAHLTPEQLTPSQQQDVATEHMLSWLQSQHDDHDGNMVIAKDGSILSVDKEQGFKYFGKDKLDTDYHPNGAYGESPPYFNFFWKAFESGKIDFDPMKLAQPLNVIEHMDAEEYVASLRGYATASFPGDKVKQDRFLAKALKRKLHLRKDFEVFLTALYKKRTGEEGEFTFDDGWLTEADKKTQKYKQVTFSGEHLAKTEYGIKEYAYIDPFTKEPQPHLGRITLKLVKEVSSANLLKFLDEIGLDAIPVFTDQTDPRVNTGPTYHMVVVNEAAYQAASVTKEVLITAGFLGTPDKPKYWPELPDPPRAVPNASDMKKLVTMKLTREGHSLVTDGSMVEGQSGKAKRWQDSKGTFLFVAFKLRKEVWKKLQGSPKVASGQWSFYEADYDQDNDVFVQKSGKSDSTSGVRWTHGKTEVFLATDSDKYAYMGSIYMKIRNLKADPMAEAKAALNDAVPGLGDDAFRNPTPEEMEVMKLSRLLWAVEPQKADKLPESQRTVAGLQKALGAHAEEAGKIEEQEVFKGYHSHVLPGRWKKIAKKTPLFVFNGIGSTESALSVLKSGLMSIHERNMAGLPQFGGSYSSDVGTGSGDGILCRVVPKSGFSKSLASHSFGGKFQAIIHPEVLDRLDTYMYNKDTFGKCKGSEWNDRVSVEHRVSVLKSSYTPYNEISFRRGLHKQKILRFTTSDPDWRKQLITQAREQGITEVNGVPLDDFVVVATKAGDIYEKYVKPMLVVD